MSQTWFITGASSGFGLDLALLALDSGHRVIGTVRNASKSASAVNAIKAKGGQVLELDVTNAASIPGVVEKANAIYGGIDVLVNNAGYSLLGAVEDMKEEEVKLQMETNFFGPFRLIKAFLPTLRSRSGKTTIVNVSSVAGQDAQPTCGLYAASKFALEGLSEALSREVAPFGITVLIVEPGAFRTNFLSAVQRTEMPLSEAYKGGPVDVVLRKFEAAQGKQRGDPGKAVKRVFEVVTGTGEAGGLRGMVLRLPLGPDCVERVEAKVARLRGDYEVAREVALSTDFD
ncbi:putative short chain oxidoreductase/dehydrogenase [Aspergillus undulatus]|uniref:putative short chain oxidoreductase/dehydrogenase n=1 Tax=Aspergillus undulatus TaxID=1810928 RepID=UPI003CCE2186